MNSWIKHPLTYLFLIALTTRLFYNIFIFGINTPPNEHDFWLEKVAFNISENKGYGLVENQPTARKLPLFSTSLAGIYKIFGHNFIAGRLFLIFLGCFSVIGIYLTCKIFCNEKTSIIAGLILACDPLYIYLSGWFLTENLFILLIIYFIYFLIKYQFEKNKIKYLVLAGIFLGLASLTRASLSLFPIFILIWSYFNNLEIKKTLRDFLIVICIMLIFLSGWILRNYLVFGEFITNETGSGRMFWGANNSEAIGDVILMSGSPRLFDDSERPNGESNKDWREMQGSPWLNVFLSAPEGLSEKKVDRKYFKKGIDWIKNNPINFILLLPKKFYFFWKFWSPHASLPDLPNIQFILAKIIYYLILFFSLIGFFFSIVDWKKHMLLYLLLANFLLSTLIFFGDVRQRIPALPIIAIFAGIGIGKYVNKSTEK